MSSPKKLILVSLDKEEFLVDDIVAMESQTIKHMIDDDCADNPIPLPNVTGSVLSKVIEYCSKHVEKNNKNESSSSSAITTTTKGTEDAELKAWDADFMKVDQYMLFDLIQAGNYLNIKGLLDLGCQTVAGMMKGKSVEEIRKQFHIVNDYPQEEEAEVRKENAWAFEK